MGMRNPHDPDDTPTPDETLPRFAAAMFRVLLSAAEREEVIGDLGREYGWRRTESAWRARLWLCRQMVGSAPALVRRGWWRGWSGFETETERMSPGGTGPGLFGWSRTP
jgi:hypothetical protein